MTRYMGLGGLRGGAYWNKTAEVCDTVPAKTHLIVPQGVEWFFHDQYSHDMAEVRLRRFFFNPSDILGMLMFVV